MMVPRGWIWAAEKFKKKTSLHAQGDRKFVARARICSELMEEEEKSNNENHPGSYCETFLPTIIKFCIRRRRLQKTLSQKVMNLDGLKMLN